MRWSRFLSVGREAAWIGVGQLVAVVGSLAAVKVLTGLLSPAAYGRLALALTALTLVQQVLTGPLGQASLRYYAPAREEGALPGYFAALRRLLAESTLLVAAFTVVVVGVGWGLAGPGGAGLVLAVAALAVASGYNATFDSVQNAARQRLVVAWHSGVLQWLKLGLAVAAIAWLGAGSGAAIVGFLVATLLVVVSQYLFSRRLLVAHAAEHTAAGAAAAGHAHAWRRDLVAYALPFTSWGVLAWMQLSADRWALQLAAGAGAVGVYNAVYQLGYAPAVLGSGLLMQVVSPILFDRAGRRGDAGGAAAASRRGVHLAVGFFLASLVGGGVLWLLQERVFALLVDESYRGASVFLAPLFVAGGIFNAGQLASLVPMLNFESRRMLKPKVVTSVLGIGLLFLGAYAGGIVGVVWAQLAYSAVYCVWRLLLARPARPPGPAAPGL